MSFVFPVPPNQPLDGRTQAEWSEEWWKYALFIPADVNPLLDLTGENAHIGQSSDGPFFLSGTFTESGKTSTVVRTIAVPTDRPIFFPLINFFDNTFGEDPPRTLAEVLNQLNLTVDQVPPSSLFTTINGQSVPNLTQQRQVSTDAFEFVLPENNLFGLPGDTPVPDAVSGGYWLLLNPLPARVEPYIINFKAASSDTGNSSALDITYIIRTYHQVTGTNGKNDLWGTEFSDEMKGLNGNDFLIGLSANDDLNGGNGADILNGVNPAAQEPGIREIDVLEGENGRDTFVLGDQNNVYYNDGQPATQGLSDYALIADLERSDVIQLHGAAHGYVLVENFSLGSLNGTAIFLKDSVPDSVNELIGVVEGASGLKLSSNSFRFT